MKRFMNVVGPLWTKYALVAGIVVFIILAAMGAPPTDKDLQETNRQLQRIADSLEIISGQHSGWKLPK